MLTDMTDVVRHWLARTLVKHYARDYLKDMNRMGLEWPLELIEEDVQSYGHPVHPALARAGCVVYAQEMEAQRRSIAEEQRDINSKVRDGL